MLVQKISNSEIDLMQYHAPSHHSTNTNVPSIQECDKIQSPSSGIDFSQIVKCAFLERTKIIGRVFSQMNEDYYYFSQVGYLWTNLDNP
jgi:hypothetical protein